MQFSDKENTLYVAIALESIKMNEIVKQEVAKNGVARQYSPSFTISITDFLHIVKDIALINEVFSEDVAENLGVNRLVAGDPRAEKRVALLDGKGRSLKFDRDKGLRFGAEAAGRHKKIRNAHG